MFPMYMNSSQPGQTQMRPQGHYHYGFESPRPHMTSDASSRVSCECWPAPSPYYGSCIHGNYPAYCPSYYPPQVPYHQCCMNYSGFHPHVSHAPPYYSHQPFPAGYQPWYGPEKDVPGDHQCTKCSTNMFQSKNDRKVVIEEHEPDVEKGDRVVRSTNCPYPIIWIPHENARNQEHGHSLGSGSHELPPTEVKVPEGTKLQKIDPRSWNGHFQFDENTMKSLLQKIQNGNSVELPFDISKLKSLIDDQKEKEVETQKNKESPYPIYWIPSPGNQADVAASKTEGRNSKSIASDLHGNEGQIAQHIGVERNSEPKVPSNAVESFIRYIPVEKQLQESRNIPVKLLEKHHSKPTEPTKSIERTEPVDKTKKERHLSQQKSYKLPPVCLRVDPLPKKKNGGSKSLSPPREKEQPLQEAKVASPLISKKVESRTDAEACNGKCEKTNKEKDMFEGPKKESLGSSYTLQGLNCGVVKPCGTKEDIKKTFTEEEAARIIQSRYRGYDVRRWEPLKKLKEIATVREQMGDVKNRIQALKPSTDKQIEGREILILEETVMRLLLKLDSVQGLHHSIRDYRKSLAKELSDIQENLDSMRKTSTFAEKEEIPPQTSNSPVNLEHSRHEEENTENVLPSFDDGQLMGEAEEGSGLKETLGTDYVGATEVGRCETINTSAAIPEKLEEVENVLPPSPLSADGNEATVTNGEEEDNAVVESLEETPQTCEGPENATQIIDGKEDSSVILASTDTEDVVPSCNEQITSGPENESGLDEDLATDAETRRYKGLDTSVAVPEKTEEVKNVENENALVESEDIKEDYDTIMASNKDLSELPIRVIFDLTELPRQDSSSCTCEVENTAMDGETSEQDAINVDQSSENSKCIDQEGFEPQEEEEQFPDTHVKKHEIPEETKRLMEENQRFKEMMETMVKAGREQLEVISKLTGRVKSLEKKLSHKRKNKAQVTRRKPIIHGEHKTQTHVLI